MNKNDLTYNKIYNEDCLTLMNKMKDNFVDVVVTSPPYNIGKGRKNGKRNKYITYDTYTDNLPKEEYFQKTSDWLDELLRVTKYHIFYNIQEIRGNKGLIKYMYENYSDNIKEVFIWAKTNPPSCINDKGVSKGYEYIFCLSKDEPNKSIYNYCNFSNYNGDYIRNCIIKPVNNDKENKGHSFAFGSWLPKYFINYFSKEDDLIYDPFMGTGTTAKASILLNRKYLGSEISKQYCEIAEKRLSKYKNQLRLF
tara:strand:+ start:6722 stop:7477 length:756 start_codon:yes stop_codon:yes gene_type:complete